MWESRFLFYTVFVALIIFILLCLICIFAVFFSLVAVGQIKDKTQNLIKKGEDTLDTLQEIVYETPSWGVTIIEGVFSFLSNRKAKKSSLWKKFF
jgi:predicted PurR-regulated permease PerM